MVLAVLAGVGVVAAVVTRSDPVITKPAHNKRQPTFADDSNVYIAENGSLPPLPLPGTDVGIKASAISEDGATLDLYSASPKSDSSVTLGIGDTGSVEGISLTLCDTWVGPKPASGENVPPGSQDYSDYAYYVYSMDGSTPACP